MSVSYFLANPIYSGDSIIDADTLTLTAVDDYYVIDTINPTDTVVFAAGFYSLGNELVAARVNFDTTQLNICARVSDDMKAVCLPKTNYRTLQFYVNPGFNGLYLPMGYRPLQSNGTYKFTMIVESDSKFSPNQVTLHQPVR